MERSTFVISIEENIKGLTYFNNLKVNFKNTLCFRNDSVMHHRSLSTNARNAHHNINNKFSNSTTNLQEDFKEEISLMSLERDLKNLDNVSQIKKNRRAKFSKLVYISDYFRKKGPAKL